MCIPFDTSYIWRSKVKGFNVVRVVRVIKNSKLKFVVSISITN